MTERPGHGGDPTEPRSALGLRTVLATFGLVVGIIGSVVIIGWFPDRDEGPAFVTALVICLAMAVTAVIDLVVIARRRRQRHAGA